MMRWRENLLVGVATWVTFSSLICRPALGRDVKLTVYPQKMSAEAGKYSLLPPEASLTAADAVPLYEKAAKALPGKKDDERIRQWLKTPVEQLPIDQVEEVLKTYLASLRFVAQASKCRECKWPAWTPGAQVANLPEYRRLALALQLWARSEIAQENCEGAVLVLQIGFGMGRHLTQAPTTVQFLTGQGINNAMCLEIAEFVQVAEAPNLYAGLAALPKLSIEIEKAIENEKKAGSSEPSVRLGGAPFEKISPFEGLRLLAKRLESDMAALQCVEALRSYAALHGGQLPQTLAEITEVSVPKDPMTGEPFRYTRTGATAVLESVMPAGGDAKNIIRYEMTVKN